MHTSHMATITLMINSIRYSIWCNQSDYNAAISTCVYVYVKKCETMLYAYTFVGIYAYAHVWENNIRMQVCQHACRI